MRREHAGGLSSSSRSTFLAGALFTPWKQLRKDASPPHSGEQPGSQSHRRLAPLSRAQTGHTYTAALLSALPFHEIPDGLP